MGKECPYCGKWGAVKRNITVDGNGATKASDVLAQVLECGHTVGGEGYESFVAESNKLDIAAMGKHSKIDKETKAKKAVLWKSLDDNTEGVD